MAISLAGYRRYLEKRAETWERMALSRARQVVGDERFGNQVARVIERFVYGREVDQALAAKMQAMRQRMEPQGKRRLGIDIKRGPGGIVDIEFAAQVLVLQAGHKDRSLRQGNTRRALHQLIAKGHLDPGRGRFLLDAYEQLRAVEKGMRIASDKASDVLPTGRGLESLSRALDVENGLSLQDAVAECMRETRRVFTAVFAELTN
jgi:glutamate-ammonia-ligase adenylyltransferase